MRPCKTRQCQDRLADLVPSHIEYCGNCQVVLRDVGQDVRAWLKGRNLPPEAIFFLAGHMDGCAIKELAVVTVLKPGTIKNHCECGRIRAKKIIDKEKVFTGRAQTSVPIFVPPGRKNIQPSLSLSYSSSSGNGWLGMGCGL